MAARPVEGEQQGFPGQSATATPGRRCEPGDYAGAALQRNRAQRRRSAAHAQTDKNAARDQALDAVQEVGVLIGLQAEGFGVGQGPIRCMTFRKAGFSPIAVGCGKFC